MVDKKECSQVTLTYFVQGRSQGGSLGSKEPPAPRPPRERKVHQKVHYNVQKHPLVEYTKCLLECKERSTITVCLINDAAYYTDIDLDTVEDLDKFRYPISARACMFQNY